MDEPHPVTPVLAVRGLCCLSAISLVATLASANGALHILQLDNGTAPRTPYGGPLYGLFVRKRKEAGGRQAMIASADERSAARPWMSSSAKA